MKPETRNSIVGRDVLFAFFIFAFVALYLSFAIPHDYRDVNRSPQWRMQHGWDEGQNVARAMSITKYGYRNNPIISKDMNQFYLMFSSFGQQFLSNNYDLPTRIALFERLIASISLSFCFVLFYLLCRMVAGSKASFFAWLCFVSASWSYLPIGTTAKEDSFCFLLTICIFITIVSILKDKKTCSTWKYCFSAFLIGLGGATKQYPLLFAIFYPLYFWKTETTFKSALFRTLKMALLIIFFLLLASPNFFLSQFNFGSPLGILVDQQSQTSASQQLHASWQIIKNIIIFRYLDIYLAILLLACIKVIKAKFNAEETMGYRFVTSHKGLLISCIVIYYAISIYKQSYFISVRYFMIGEVAFFLLLALLTERLFQLENTKLKIMLISVLFFEAFIFNWRRGNFNYALQVSGAEQSIREIKNSVFDELEIYLKDLKPEQTKTILSHWYVYISPELRPIYVNKIEMGYEAAKIYLAKEYGFNLINADLDHKLIEEEHPTLFLSLNPLHEQSLTFTKCFNLIRTIKAMQPNLYSNYLSALVHFHKTNRKVELNEDPYPFPAGTTVYVYDTRSCHEEK